MVRSILLRGFDQQMAGMIGKNMEENGIKFIKEAVPTEIIEIKKGEPGELNVKYVVNNGEIKEEIFNTVVFAVGRDPCTSNIGIENSGVKLNPK
jgi:pyruvate/2-oxoglutarate dehydrogenase complex dihydrolipoamide dehydrogenase (E3) component